MPLKYSVDSLDSVEEGFRTLYQKSDDGKYVLNVDGAAPKTKLDEFRATNIELLRKLEGYKDVDLSKYKSLLETEQKIREKQLIEAGKVDEVVTERIRTLRTELENQVNEKDQALNIANKQLEVLLIDNAVKSAAIASGVLPTAVDDVILRAKTMFSIKDGNPVALDVKGEIVYDIDGEKPLSIDSWLKSLKKSAPHLFAGSQGGGAGGAGGHLPRGSQNLSATQKIAMGLSGQ